MAKKPSSEVDFTQVNKWDGEIPEGYEEEHVGFDPYWNPAKGKMFSGTVISRDDRDPNFIRYVLIADRELMCASGPAKEAEPVPVKPGDMFTVSDYTQLPLAELFGLKIMAVSVDLRPSRTHAGQEFWTWKLFLPPESKRALHSRRAEAAQLFSEQAKEPALKSA